MLDIKDQETSLANVKDIDVGFVDVKDEQAWPTGRRPWPNTVAYFPLIDDVIDKVQWLSLTANWTKEVLGRTFNTSVTFSDRDKTKPTMFVSMMLKVNSWIWGSTCCTQLFDLWEHPCCYVTSHSESWLRNTVHYKPSSWSSWPRANTWIVQWNWYHFCYWIYNGRVYMRVNWNKTEISWANITGTNDWWNDFVRINWNWVNITCSEYIMESVWWSDDEVSEYFNKIKSLYWIS